MTLAHWWWPDNCGWLYIRLMLFVCNSDCLHQNHRSKQTFRRAEPIRARVLLMTLSWKDYKSSSVGARPSREHWNQSAKKTFELQALCELQVLYVSENWTVTRGLISRFQSYFPDRCTRLDHRRNADIQYELHVTVILGRIIQQQ